MENTAISGRFCIYDIVSEYAEAILTCTENTLKVYKRKREYARSILPYVENTPIDIKFSLCRQIFDQNKKKSDPKSPSSTWSNGQKNNLTLLSL